MSEIKYPSDRLFHDKLLMTTINNSNISLSSRQKMEANSSNPSAFKTREPSNLCKGIWKGRGYTVCLAFLQVLYLVPRCSQYIVRFQGGRGLKKKNIVVGPQGKERRTKNNFSVFLLRIVVDRVAQDLRGRGLSSMRKLIIDKRPRSSVAIIKEGFMIETWRQDLKHAISSEYAQESLDLTWHWQTKTRDERRFRLVHYSDIKKSAKDIVNKVQGLRRETILSIEFKLFKFQMTRSQVF